MRDYLPTWVKFWLAASGVICLLDVGFTMLRPHTLRGHKWGNLYYLWHIYADVDYRYADANDLVTQTTGRLMFVEIIMNFNSIGSPHTLLTAFTSSVLVFWKTAIYLSLYINPPQGNHSEFNENATDLQIFWVFWFMNGLWVIFPFFVMCSLWEPIVFAQKVCDDIEDSETATETFLESSKRKKKMIV